MADYTEGKKCALGALFKDSDLEGKPETYKPPQYLPPNQVPIIILPEMTGKTVESIILTSQSPNNFDPKNDSRDILVIKFSDGTTVEFNSDSAGYGGETAIVVGKVTYSDPVK